MLEIGCDGKKRCFGNNSLVYAKYHDQEWALAVHDDQKLFEMLILEGAQAGLSWETVLNKREGYRQAFHNFDVQKVSHMSDYDLEQLRINPAIIRNRLKIYSVRKNAKIFIKIQQEFGSFASFVWSFVANNTIVNHWSELNEVPVTTPQSDALSKELKKRGMSFVGPTIMYAFMQAVGMVNDHIIGCWRYGKHCGAEL